MQEHFQKSTNFAQSQWLMGDLFAQRGSVRSDVQKRGQHLHLIGDPHLPYNWVCASFCNPTSLEPLVEGKQLFP